MDDLHLLEDSGAIVGDDNSTLRILDLYDFVVRDVKIILTILSMPLGPREVLTTSATALAAVMLVDLTSFDFSQSFWFMCLSFIFAFDFKLINYRWNVYV